jgi:hypothetical protein
MCLIFGQVYYANMSVSKTRVFGTGGTDIKDAAVMEAALAIYTPIDATSRDYVLISMRTRVLDISLAQQYVPPPRKRKFISLIRGTDN